MFVATFTIIVVSFVRTLTFSKPEREADSHEDSKVADTKSKIPREWLLKQADLDKASDQRNLTGSFIESFLDDRELEIIRNDSVRLVEKIKCQQYTSFEVTQAYCKTAAIAQQIVSQ